MSARAYDGPERRRVPRDRPRRAGATIEQVASQAGVSVATVSRALRGLPNVAASTRARVEAAAEQLDYRADVTAARLASGRTDAIALAVPSIGSWYHSTVAAGVESVLAPAGLDTLLIAIDEPDAKRRVLADLRAVTRRIDGIILVDILLDEEEIAMLQSSGTAVVTVGQHTGRFPSIRIDDRGAARLATQHLLNLGHTAIGLISGFDPHGLQFDVPRLRHRGYLDALDAAGVEPVPGHHVDGHSDAVGGADAMARLLAAPVTPTAVFATSDEMAFGAMRTCTDLGYAVPDEMAIIGFDDHPLSEAVGLTTIRQDVRELGRCAAQLLVEGRSDLPAASEEKSHEVVAETRLVVRRTTRRPARPSTTTDPGSGR